MQWWLLHTSISMRKLGWGLSNGTLNSVNLGPTNALISDLQVATCKLMASLAAEQVARELECPVCFKQYKEPPSDLAPVLLAACGHTICRGDAARIISSKSALKCPSCSSITEAPHGAAGLPVNFAVVSLLSLVAGAAAAPAPRSLRKVSGGSRATRPSSTGWPSCRTAAWRTRSSSCSSVPS